MAIVHLQREWYRPKMPVIHYVSQQRVLIRSRPARVRNPRTKAQQANRSKMSIASRFLSHFQAFVAQGFAEGKRPNGRPIGAYHMALGHLLNNGMKRENGAWKIDYESVQLSEGQSVKSFPIRVNRQGRTLRLSWPEGLPEGTQRLRLAFYQASRGESLRIELNAPREGASIEILLPKWAQSGPLHLWWCPEVRGKAKWRTGYILIPKDITVVVGWMLMRRRETNRGVGMPRESRGRVPTRRLRHSPQISPPNG